MSGRLPCVARISVLMPPRTLKSPVTSSQRGLATATKSSRIRLVVLVEGALLAGRPQIELERIQLDQVLVGHVPDADRREVRLARAGAEARELGHRHRDLVVAVRVRVRHDLERLRRRGGHGAIIPKAPQRFVSPMPTATAAQASTSSGVSGSPATSAAATTPKIGCVRKNAESALGRYLRRSARFTTKLNPEISTPW